MAVTLMFVAIPAGATDTFDNGTIAANSTGSTEEVLVHAIAEVPITEVSNESPAYAALEIPVTATGAEAIVTEALATVTETKASTKALVPDTSAKVRPESGGYGYYPANDPGEIQNGFSSVSKGSSVQQTVTPLWTFQTGNNVFSSPEIVNDVVYIGSDDGNVYAINLTTGQKKWNFNANGPIWASPTVSGGIVYVGSTENNFYAINAVNGTVQWIFHP